MVSLGEELLISLFLFILPVFCLIFSFFRCVLRWRFFISLPHLLLHLFCLTLSPLPHHFCFVALPLFSYSSAFNLPPPCSLWFSRWKCKVLLPPASVRLSSVWIFSPLQFCTSTLIFCIVGKTPLRFSLPEHCVRSPLLFLSSTAATEITSTNEAAISIRESKCAWGRSRQKDKGQVFTDNNKLYLLSTVHTGAAAQSSLQQRITHTKWELHTGKTEFNKQWKN